MHPGYSPMHRVTISKVIIKLFNKRKRQMKLLLGEATSKISLTTDMWTSPNHIPIIGITAHWYNKAKKLVSAVLDFKQMKHPHDGESICGALKESIGDFGLEGRIMGITTDNDSKMLAGLRLLKDSEPNLVAVRCAAHVINLTASAGLDSLEREINTTRTVIKKLQASGMLYQTFKSIQRELDPKLPARRIPLDVETRWNSTYLMLSTAVDYQRALNDLVKTMKVNAKEKKSLTISEDEWEDVDWCLTLLKPFYDATNEVFHKDYPTLNTVLPVIYFLSDHLATFVTGKPLVTFQNIVLIRLCLQFVLCR